MLRLCYSLLLFAALVFAFPVIAGQAPNDHSPGVHSPGDHASDDQVPLDQVPLDQDGFTAYAAKSFKDADPTAAVTVEAPLRLKVTKQGDVWDSDLHNIYSYCRRNPEICASALAVHAHQLATTHRPGGPAPPTATALRIVVRPIEYVEAIARNLAGKGDPIAEPIAGDLWAVVVIDRPETVSILKPSDLKTLNLTADEAMARAKQNTKAELGGRLPRPHPSDGSLSVLHGDSYESSLLAFPEIWAPLAKAYGGRLIVAVPGTYTVMFVKADKQKSVAALSAVAAAAMDDEFRPLSNTVFRWTDKGWVAASR